MYRTPSEESGQRNGIGSYAEVEHSPPNADGIRQFQERQWPKQRLGQDAVVGNENAYDYGIF
jgi:hypothetical protein